MNPFILFALAVTFIIAFGALSMIGRHLGNKKVELAQNVFKTALILVFGFSVTYGLLGFIFAPTLARMLGSNQHLLDSVVNYIRFVSPFLVFQPLMILTGFADRIVGKPKLYLQGTIAMLIANTSLSIILIKYLNLGVKGSALATGLALLSGFLVTVGPMLDKDLSINIHKGKFDTSVIYEMLYNGASEGVGSGATALMIYLFNLELMSRLGANGVAAFTTISIVVTFGINVIFGIADGISPIVSYNYGHGRMDRVYETLRLALLSGLALGIFICFILTTFGGHLAGLFAKSHEIKIIATEGAFIYGFAFIVSGLNIIASVYFTSIGAAKESVMIAMSRGIIWVVLGIQVLPLFLGVRGVWLVVPLAEWATIILVAYLLKTDYERNRLEVPSCLS